MKLNERTIIGILIVIMFAVWFWQIRAHNNRDYLRTDNVKPMIDQVEDLQQRVNQLERKMVDLENKVRRIELDAP